MDRGGVVIAGDVVTVVQARRGSTRLPGKVLHPLGGGTVLEVMLERVRRASLVGTVVVATTTSPADDEIVRVAERANVNWFRGHPTDLLDRHYRVAVGMNARHLVKIPSDCPLIDPAIIDAVLAVFRDAAGTLDYVSNLHPPTHPDGNDVEVFGFDALEAAWRESSRAIDREHTTPYLWDNPQRFRCANVRDSGRDRSCTHRTVLDYPEDYALIRRVYEALAPGNPHFTVTDIVRFLDENPETHALNARHRGTHWYRGHLGELRTRTAGAIAGAGAT